jgi:hypothetical protein
LWQEHRLDFIFAFKLIRRERAFEMNQLLDYQHSFYAASPTHSHQFGSSASPSKSPSNKRERSPTNELCAKLQKLGRGESRHSTMRTDHDMLDVAPSAADDMCTFLLSPRGCCHAVPSSPSIALPMRRNCASQTAIHAMLKAIESQGFGKDARLYFADLCSPPLTIFTLRDALDAECSPNAVLRFVFGFS